MSVLEPPGGGGGRGASELSHDTEQKRSLISPPLSRSFFQWGFARKRLAFDSPPCEPRLFLGSHSGSVQAPESPHLLPPFPPGRWGERKAILQTHSCAGGRGGLAPSPCCCLPTPGRAARKGPRLVKCPPFYHGCLCGKCSEGIWEDMGRPTNVSK